MSIQHSLKDQIYKKTKSSIFPGGMTKNVVLNIRKNMFSSQVLQTSILVSSICFSITLCFVAGRNLIEIMRALKAYSTLLCPYCTHSIKSFKSQVSRKKI